MRIQTASSTFNSASPFTTTPSAQWTFLCRLAWCVHPQACTGPDVGFLIGAVVVAFAILWCVYGFIARESMARRTSTLTFVSTVCSQFVTLFQMSVVLNTLSVAWPDPFVKIIEVASLLNFRLEVLNIGCVATAPKCTDMPPTPSLASFCHSAW